MQPAKILQFPAERSVNARPRPEPVEPPPPAPRTPRKRRARTVAELPEGVWTKIAEMGSLLCQDDHKWIANLKAFLDQNGWLSEKQVRVVHNIFLRGERAKAARQAKDS